MLAMSRTLAHLKSVGSLDGAQDQLIGFAQRQDIVDFNHWTGLDRKYAQLAPSPSSTQAAPQP